MHVVTVLKLFLIYFRRVFAMFDFRNIVARCQFRKRLSDSYMCYILLCLGQIVYKSGVFFKLKQLKK